MQRARHVELGGVKASPTRIWSMRASTWPRREGVDFVLAIGGGSVMYSAKRALPCVKHDGDILRPLFAIMNPELMMTLPPPIRPPAAWQTSSPTAWSVISPTPRTASSPTACWRL